MADQIQKKMSDQQLRVMAETNLLSNRPLVEVPLRTETELLHELQVHQIELQMQNEVLRQAQVELEKSRDRYADLYEFAPVGYLTLSHAGLVAEANLAAAAMLGINRHRLINRRLVTFVADADKDRWDQELGLALKHSEARQFTVALKRKDALPVQVNVACKTAKVDDGVPSVLIALTDITVLKNAEALRAKVTQQTLAQLSAITDTTVDAVVVEDMSGIIESWNPAAEKMFGYTAAEMLGQPTSKIIPAELLQETSASLQAVFAGSYLPAMESRRRHKDGSSIGVSLSHSPLKAADGSQLGVVTIIRDISAQKQAEAKLRESEETLRAALQFSPNAIFMARADGRLTFANRMAETLLGYSSKELLRMTVSETLPPDAREDALARFRNTLKGKHEFFETVLVSKDGRRIDVAIHGVLLPTGNALGEIQDITEAKRTALELEQHRNHLEAMVGRRTTELAIAKEAAESANRAKSMFLANMSHEVRTPMNGILGMIDLATRRITDPKALDQLDKARSSARRLSSFLNDLIDISQIEAERLTLDRVVFNIGTVLEGVEESNKHRAAEKGLGLGFDVSPEIPGRSFAGDPVRLGQILNDLIDNAIKFTERGSIVVRVRLAEDNAADALLQFEVEDTGIGIEPGDQSRIFKLFEQGDGTSTRKFGGTGLGLALCKRLAKMMGGSIAVASKKAVGSTFRFTARLGIADLDPGKPVSADVLDTVDPKNVRNTCRKLLGMDG